MSSNSGLQKMSNSSFRFKRIAREVLGYLHGIKDSKDFYKCQSQFIQQIEELIQQGYTWGYSYPIPVHDSDIKALSAQEWISIKSIVNKQQYAVSPNNR